MQLTERSYPLLLLGSIIYGASRALASGALDAWFIDELQTLDPDIDLQPKLAQGGMLTLLALAIGTFLGGVLPTLLEFLPAEGTAILTPFSSTLVLSVVVQLIRLVLIVFLVQEKRPAVMHATARDSFNDVPVFIRDALQISRESHLIRWLLATAFIAGFVLFSIENFWQPHFALLLGGSEGNSMSFGFIMAGSFVLGAVGNMVSIPLAKALKQRLGLVAGLFELLRGAALLLLVLQQNVVPAIALFWLIYFGMGGSTSPAATMFHAEVPADRRASMLSIHSMVVYVGIFVGSLTLGVVAEFNSIVSAWAIGGAVLVLLLWPYLHIDRLYTTQHVNHAKNETLHAQIDQETNAI